MTLMRINWTLLALVLSAAVAGGAEKAAPSDINQSVSFPGGVAVQRDLVYATIEGFRPLTLDLYQPASKAKEPTRPAILYIHGGGWMAGDARHLKGFDDFPSTLAGLAAKGMVVAAVNYRLAGEAHFPAAVQDVKSALRWLRGHATDYNIDTTRVMIWGVEAGGQIASLAGTSCGVATLEPAADAGSKAPLASDCVQGVIDWAGPTDFASWDADAGRNTEAAAATHLGTYLGCEPADCAPGIVRSASPLTYVGAQSPPFFIQQGAEDKFAAPAQSHKLYDALRAQRVPADIRIYAGAGQDFAKDGTPDRATGAQALADMEDFIAKTFPPPPEPEASANPTKKSVKPAKAKTTKAHK
ncbi:MAG TPA: alpha/beta hydrolase [Rhizomicrobium sp.]|jgi:acetyl esterase/lipase|nr:alpha/beta hydrolase [Rhizomicrobium sp.]